MSNVVILKWNPSFSSYEMFSYLMDLRQANISNGLDVDFDWSVFEHEKIHEGDRVFWVKLGYGQTGIVASGYVIGEPYEGEDWSGKGRETYYVNFEPDVMLNPDTLPILSTQTLSEKIPDFEWNKGHSGMVLSSEQAKKLEKLWDDFLRDNESLFQHAIVQQHDDQIYVADDHDEDLTLPPDDDSLS